MQRCKIMRDSGWGSHTLLLIHLCIIHDRNDEPRYVYHVELREHLIDSAEGPQTSNTQHSRN